MRPFSLGLLHLSLGLSAVAGPPFLTLATDPRLELTPGERSLVLAARREPYLFCSSRGTLFVQAAVDGKPLDARNRAMDGFRVGSAISRDGGRTWTPWTLRKGRDDVDIEAGMMERRDGTLLLYDTYVILGKADQTVGTGQLVVSKDDLRSFQGPLEVPFHFPPIGLAPSTGDNGASMLPNVRLHRSLLELPNGELLMLGYTAFSIDRAPASYMPSMMKSRVILLRSRDGGMSWDYAGTIAVDEGRGTEGYDEAVMARVTHPRHFGRLLCLMRTGRELFQSHSDDNGANWSEAAPVRLPGVDIYAVRNWEGLFGLDPKAPGYVADSNMIGALVDPDLIEMGNGTLVCSFGFRAPEKLFRKNWRAARNGNYLALSCDGGDTWSEVVQYLSGEPTAQYTAVREVAPGRLLVLYSESPNHAAPGRIMGLTVTVKRSSP